MFLPEYRMVGLQVLLLEGGHTIPSRTSDSANQFCTDICRFITSQHEEAGWWNTTTIHWCGHNADIDIECPSEDWRENSGGGCSEPSCRNDESCRRRWIHRNSSNSRRPAADGRHETCDHRRICPGTARTIVDVGTIGKLDDD